MFTLACMGGCSPVHVGSEEGVRSPGVTGFVECLSCYVSARILTLVLMTSRKSSGLLLGSALRMLLCPELHSLYSVYQVFCSDRA